MLQLQLHLHKSNKLFTAITALKMKHIQYTKGGHSLAAAHRLGVAITPLCDLSPHHSRLLTPWQQTAPRNRDVNAHWGSIYPLSLCPGNRSVLPLASAPRPCMEVSPHSSSQPPAPREPGPAASWLLGGITTSDHDKSNINLFN